MPVTVDELNQSTSICFSALASKEGLTPRKIIKEIKDIALSDLKHHITVDEGGAVTAKPLSEMGRRSRAVKKVKEKCVITESKDGEKIYKESTIEYELYNKLEALDMAMTIHGMKIKKIEAKHSGNITVDTGIRRPMDDQGEDEKSQPGAISEAVMTGIER